MCKEQLSSYKNNLIELLSKKQQKLSYQTNQEMHLKNNLVQLVYGEQQYKDQQQKLNDLEKEQQASGPAGTHDNRVSYIDQI
mmetsp:Transcript_14582/g.24882  ORF Transcript_14582/g.24882 Transcript_14582/m.24882 type:complete len:82 (+) Transcript_14582:395-640(+)